MTSKAKQSKPAYVAYIRSIGEAVDFEVYAGTFCSYRAALRAARAMAERHKFRPWLRVVDTYIDHCLKSRRYDRKPLSEGRGGGKEVEKRWISKT